MTYIIKRSGDVLLAEGIFLVILGLIMIYLSQTTTVILAFLLTTGLVFLGIYRIINSIIMRKEIVSPFLSIMSGFLLLIIGLYLIFHPIFNTLILTAAAAVYFIFESVNSFSSAISSKGFKQIFWVSLFTGLIQLFLAGIIVLGLPYTAIWFLGMLLGINFIFAGITSISEYSYLRTIWNEA